MKTDRLLKRYFSGDSISYRQIISIIIPILVDQAFVVCLNLLNTAMISSSGVAAVSAVNMVDSLNIFLVNVFIAVATGGTVVVAQYKGCKNDAMVSKAAAGSVSAVFLLSLAVSLTVVLFHTSTLSLLFGKAEADVFSNARVYLIGCSASYCGIATVEAVCGALRGVGETRSSLFLALTMNLSYVALNFLFINVLNMGVLGMVIALNIARYIGAACSILYLIKGNSSVRLQIMDLFRFDLNMLKRILYIGLPFAAEQMFFNGGKILTQTFIVQLGVFAMDTNAISNSIVSLFQIPANALLLSTVTVVGQCMGRRDVNDARKFIKSFIGLSSFSFAVMLLIVIPLFGPLVSLFHPPASVVPKIFQIVCITGLSQVPLWSFSFITPAALRAAGDSRYTSVVSMLSMWLFRVVLGYVLGILLPFGIVGVWVAMICEWGVRGSVFVYRFRGKKWYQHHLIDN
ncbi:MATE family efflux transporter [Caproiciproducens faecalis]|uniref:Probable multidrug resistance protein NorM n=1 Tax=Caproiciproducens faecalis TaxID=2820301 RepID=A0ABS7DMT4_9FIRM|nr:MATE family efflux transporter [Caproiciproducens faecalis]MBW7572528.1 MATE family efflux transporter [Caproiciproducens faecalis]